MSKKPKRERRASPPVSEKVPTLEDAQRPEEQSTPAAGEGNASPQASAPRPQESTGQPHGPLVVGIGASAGGLEALEQLFSHVPKGSGLAYVVVQHLAPQHASMLPEILGRRTEMPVVQAKDGVLAQPDHVYVIVPGTSLGISGGSFQVASAEAERHGQIDAFLRRLAEDQRERAVGVLLSGSGADGTIGLRAIRDHGGLTVAQTPETAKYDNMPRSAIDAGLVDYVLPPEDIPAKLLDHAQGVAEGRVPAVAPRAVAPPAAGEAPSDEELAAALNRISETLQRSTGHDFSHYKRGTVLRRLRRRLQQRRPASLDEYLDLLGKDGQEADLLAKDLLIGVTQFFRDPEAFEHLGLHVLPKIIAADRADEGVRIWVPGCASGEEAYSIGILLREHLAQMSPAPGVQIFGTDIDVEAIAEARQARYSVDITEHVSPGRLARFFTRDGSNYQVSKEVREMCIFSEHSLIRDPPFLGLHLISCRNLLIYLDAALQKKLVPVFHYALKPGGYLFLGPSESLAEHPELFETVDKRFRIFKRVESAIRPVVEFPLAGRTTPRAAPPMPHPPATTAPTQEQLVNAAFERMMLQEYTPPGAVVNERGDVLCVAGLTGRYLQPPAGVLTTNILDIAHASLRVELRTALHAAVRGGKKVVRDDVSVEVNGTSRRLRLTVRPMSRAKQNGLFAVILQEATGGEEAETPEGAEPSVLGADSASLIEQLESELRTTRADLRATIEELESSNEELKSSNEEMLSTNEELQSANEELQSSQEELKSVNEELSTVNAELARKVDELGRANSDLQNLFASSDVITLFLDRELRLARFTPAARTFFRLIDADAGRPLTDLAPRFAEQDLGADANEVLRTLRTVEREVETVDRRAWYVLRILPYRTVENVVAGVVITLADITRVKHAEADLRRLATALINSNDAITVLDLDGRILEWNRGAERMYGYSAAEAQQMNYDALVPEENRPQFRGRLAAIPRGEKVESLEVRRRTKDGRMLDVWLTVTKVADDRGRPSGMATTERDISDRKHAEKELKAALARLEEADRRKNEFLAMLSHELRNPLAPIHNSIYILDRAAPGGEQARRAQAVIDRQIGYMTRIIEDLLDVTRISSGKIHLQLELLDLNELAQGTVEDHRGAFVQSGVGLEMLASPEQVWVDGDRTRLSQVVGNLLQNAVKFTPRDGKTTVSIEADSARGRAILRVEDSGRGIAPELLPNLFEPFTQADTSLDRAKGGLGLGLALVKGLVEMHGGSVHAESDGPDKGAAFMVALPLKATGAIETHAPRADRKGIARRVLIIEDNNDGANSLREVLELGGHRVEIAFSGPEGLEMARASRPEVVICDIGLPEMDGYAVARAMRADPDLNRVALVALTGYASHEDVAKAKEAGFDAHLAKPPSMEAIEKVLEDVQGRGQDHGATS